MNETTQLRLVAYIFPEENSWGFKTNEDDRPRLALSSEKEHPRYRLALNRVGPSTNSRKPGIWIYNDKIAFPHGDTLEDFKKFSIELAEAIESPVLHKYDFTII